MHVLITNASGKQTLAAVRSLGKKGVEITAVSDRKDSVSFFSKYCNHRIVLPPPRISYSSPNDVNRYYIQTLLNAVKKGNYDVLLVADSESAVYTSQFMDDFSPYIRIPLPNYKTMQIASDKRQTLRFAEKIGISIPKTFYPNDKNEVRDIAKEIHYPAVAKLPIEMYAKGVEYINSQKEMTTKYEKLCKMGGGCEDTLPIIQERIQGGAFGFFALFNHSKPRAIFMHRRIREYPITGGPAVMAESVYDPELRNAGLKILKELNWHGLAMVEFKLDVRDKKFKLMEINPRLWGSLDLAIASGVDFPYLTCKMIMDGDIKSVFKYKVGLKMQWPIPGNLLYLLKNTNKGYAIYKFTRELFDKKIKNNILFDDVKPNLFLFFRMVSSIYRRYKRS